MLCFYAELPIQAALVNHKSQILLSREKEQSFSESNREKEAMGEVICLVS